MYERKKSMKTVFLLRFSFYFFFLFIMLLFYFYFMLVMLRFIYHSLNYAWNQPSAHWPLHYLQIELDIEESQALANATTADLVDLAGLIGLYFNSYIFPYVQNLNLWRLWLKQLYTYSTSNVKKKNGTRAVDLF